MDQSSRDETICALRRVCDRYVARRADAVFSKAFADEIFANIPHGALQAVIRPAIGADDGLVSVRIDPDFHFYVAFTAEYWASLRHGAESSTAFEGAK